MVHIKTLRRAEMAKKKLGLYIHIPFCRRKCLYCDFCSFTDKSREYVTRYAERLCKEIDAWGRECGGYTVDTVYFGGGTPTLLSLKDFERVMSTVFTSFSVDPECEISSECNPATADLEYLKGLRALGVNRLSIGLQSTHDNELRALGRIHSYSDFIEIYKNARRAGFENLSADLMYGIPEQTLRSFEGSLREMISLSPEHISAYGLKIEEGTPFGKRANTLVLPDEDAELDMYMMCGDILSENGYNKYEISNFAHKGYESKHNMKYWRCEEYIGVGVSAHSYFRDERFANSRDMESYMQGKDITCGRVSIGAQEKQTEYVMLRMRLCDGVNKKEFRELFGVDFDGVYGKKLAKYILQGYLRDAKEAIAFTDKGFFVSNFILSDILEF